MQQSFSDLGVPESIISALRKNGIETPFAIQAATIADAMAGRDVCGRAPTGSGKTIAFGIPVVATVDKGRAKFPKALILAPTRELADQIAAELKTFSGDVRVGVVYGGVGYGPQLNALRKGLDVLVACPGRLEDLIEQRAVDLSEVNIVVLDEADRMADMGFMPAVKRLLDQTASQRQTVLFSATLDRDVAAITERYQRDPVRHEVGEETPDITAADHVFWKADRVNRTEIAADAVTAVWPAIIFCRTRHGSDRLAKQLARRGVKAAAIHGGRSQAQRTRALRDFADNKVEALVATDVAARGIHVDGVALVVHFDPPEDHKTYIHRAGRTARAGEGGVVLSLIQPDQVKDTRRMQKRADLDEPITDPATDALRDLAPPAPKRRPAKQSSSRDHDNRSETGEGGRSDSRGSSGKPRRSNGNGADRNKRSNSAGGRNSSSADRGGNGSAGNGKPGAATQTADESSPSSRSSAGKSKRNGPARAKGSSTGARTSGASNKPGSGSAGVSNKAKSSKRKHAANDSSGPDGKPNRKARRAHLQKQG